MIVIDATNIILGRMASFAAKQALLGETVEIINSGKAIVTGNKKRTLKDQLEKLERGSSTRGPFTFKRTDMFVKRVIRGMLPYNKENGKKAVKRIRCYVEVPDKLKDAKLQNLKGMTLSKLTVVKYTTVKEICNVIGGRVWKQLLRQVKEKGQSQEQP